MKKRALHELRGLISKYPKNVPRSPNPIQRPVSSPCPSSSIDRLRIRSRSSDISSSMDWQGQKLAEKLMQILLVSFALGGFVSGYIVGSFQLMLMVYAGGVALTAIVAVPNWPWFNKHPLTWLEPIEAERNPKPEKVVAVGGKKKFTKQK